MDHIITEYCVECYSHGDDGLPSLTIINNHILKFCGWIIMTNTSISETCYFSLCVMLHSPLFILDLFSNSYQ